MANLSNINNKFIVTDGGNVLIGQTNNSSGILQIKDTQTSSFNDGLAITRNNAAQTGYINMVGGAFNFNSPGLSYKFRNNGTQTLELDSSGNVGIGITPNVNSNVVNVIQLGKGMTLLGNVNDDRATMAANLYLDTGTAFRYVMDGLAGRFSIEDGNMVWGTASSGTAGTVATVETKMTLLNNGFLGINRNSPNGLLHQQSEAGSNSEYYIQTGDTTTNSTIYFGDSDSSIHGGIDYDHNDDSMSFKVNNSTRMRIKSDGVITFSTTAVTSTPAGSINHGSNNFLYVTGGTGGASFGDDAHATRMIVFDNNYVRFDTGGTERMRITNAGQVQVGYYNTARGGSNTTFMTGKSGTTYLELNGGDVNGEGGILFADGSGGNYGLINYSHVSDIMQFYTASGEKMRITNAGQVNIYPVNDTSEAFRVFRGTGAYASQSISIDAKGGDANIRLLATDTARSTVFYRSSDGGGNFAESMRIDNNGSIGMGANSAPYRLRVKSDATVDNGIYLSAGSSSANHILYVENQDSSAEYFAVRGDGEIRLNATSGHTFANKGIRFGTNASANNLDDYEEGTFTATTNNDGVGLPVTANYRKIGQLVTYTVYIPNWSPTSAGTAVIAGFPFTAITSNGYGVGNVTHSTGVLNCSGGYHDGTNWNGTQNNSTGRSSWVVASARSIMVSGFYYTTS
jgi:hypothetical protein